MRGSPTSPGRVNVAQKQAEALRLRSKGMNFEGIAQKLGYRSAAGAHKAVVAGLQKTLREPADELRTMEAERLDRMLEGLWDKAVSGDTWSVDRVLNIMERRTKLLGLDQTPRKDLSEEAQKYLDLMDLVRIDAKDMSE